MTVIPISQQIKIHTQDSHQQLEKAIVSEIRKITTVAHYINFLEIFYGYFAALEIEIDKFVTETNLSDYAKRRKAGFIAADLKSLNASLPIIARGEEIPSIDNSLQAFGALYVMEGSTLGGKFIAKMIKAQLQKPKLLAVTFFNGYGEQTAQMWEAFKISLDGQSIITEEIQTILMTANETFVKFSLWLGKQPYIK